MCDSLCRRCVDLDLGAASCRLELEDVEVAARHLHGDVVDRRRRDRALEPPRMGMAVQDEVGEVLRDRDTEPRAAEESVDAERLALQRVVDRRVVEEDDPERAVRDGLEPCRDRLRLGRRLGVYLPQERLAEVGEEGAGKAADEPLRPDDPDVEAVDLGDRPVAVEDEDAGRLKRVRHLVAASEVVVVVAEDGVDRRPEALAGVGEHPRLLGVAVRRHVASEQDQVGLAVDLGEGGLDPLAVGLACMHVACGGDPNRAVRGIHEDILPRIRGPHARVAGRHGRRGGLRAARPDRALAALEEAGFRPERPLEDWLLKAYDDDVLVDLIFNPASGPIDDEILRRAETLEVLALPMPVAALEDVMVTKLLALTEQEPDFGGCLEIARSLREQIDWQEVRKRTADAPFATAFFTLVEELGVVPAA